MNECSFDLPELSFSDRTIHWLDAKLPGGAEMGFLVRRLVVPPGKSLRDLVTEHVVNEAKQRSGYAVLEQRDVVIGGVPAIDVRARWRHEGQVVYQRQAHLSVGDSRLLFTTTALLADQARCDESLAWILESIRFRDME